MSVQRAFRLSDEADASLKDYAKQYHAGNVTQAINALIISGFQNATGKQVMIPRRQEGTPGKPIDWEHIKREIKRISDGVKLTPEERAERYANKRGIWPDETPDQFMQRRAQEGSPHQTPEGSMAEGLSQLKKIIGQ